MNICGSVDMVTTENATGWLFAPDAKTPIAVEAHINHQIIGAAHASGLRPDLAAVGFGDGRCGFDIRFDRPVDPSYLPFIVVRPAGGDLELPRTTRTGYREFFGTFFSRYPVTARTRSLLGGLWTDRVDAASVLKSRRAIGLVPAAVDASLRSLILDGYVVLGTEEHPLFVISELDEQISRRVAKLLFAEPILDVLQQILEDHPLALRHETVTGSGFYQASGLAETSSPAECVALVAPAQEESIVVEILRDSHLLPEFTAEGHSRWIGRGGLPVEVAERLSGSVEQLVIPPGAAALLSPGLIHRLTSPNGTSTLRTIIIPNRLAPFAVVKHEQTRELTHSTGARILVTA